MSEPFNVSFAEVGLDYELGSELYRAFKISPSDLADPHTSDKLRRVAQFLSSHESPKRLIRDIVMRNNSHVSNLDYLDNLVQLYNEREKALSDLVESSKRINKYGTND